MAFQGFKVHAQKVKKNDLAFIIVKLNTGMKSSVPATVIAKWDSNPELNVWMKELLGAGQDQSRLSFDEATVGADTKRAVAEFEAFRDGKVGHKAEFKAGKGR
jgi:hypothetical protein